MSSDLQVTKICMGCGVLFNAKQHRTKYCSHRCNQQYYKTAQRNKRVDETRAVTLQLVKQQPAVVATPLVNEANDRPRELLNTKELAYVCSISERTLFRLMKSEHFPKIKVGKRLLFDKSQVLEYFNHKYGNT